MKFLERLNLITNVVVIIMAAAMGYWMLTQDRNGSNVSRRSFVGEVIPDSLFSAPEEKKLLVFLSPHCRYCDEELPAIKKTLDEISTSLENSVSITVVMPSANALHRNYLQSRLSKSFPIVEAFRNPILGAVPTPAILAVGNNNRVTREWIGSSKRSGESKRIAEILKWVADKQ